MSASDAGKGDSDRVSNYRAYRARYDLIDWNKGREPVYEDRNQEKSNLRDLDTAAR